MRWPAHRLTLPLALAILLAGCTNDPIRYIPPGDRTTLQSQARLGESDAGAANGAISVDELLRRAKTNEAAPPPPSRILLHFDGATIQPDGAQRATLRDFAERLHARLVVSSRPGSFDDPGAPLLGQRRAVAVSRELAPFATDVEMRFVPSLPPGVVMVAAADAPADRRYGTGSAAR